MMCFNIYVYNLILTIFSNVLSMKYIPYCINTFIKMVQMFYEFNIYDSFKGIINSFNSPINTTSCLNSNKLKPYLKSNEI